MSLRDLDSMTHLRILFHVDLTLIHYPTLKYGTVTILGWMARRDDSVVIQL